MILFYLVVTAFIFFILWKAYEDIKRTNIESKAMSIFDEYQRNCMRIWKKVLREYFKNKKEP